MSDLSQPSRASAVAPALPRAALRWPIVLLAAAYFIAALGGHALAPPPGDASLLWPATGLALAALLLFGMRCWVGVWLGAFLFYLWLDHSLAGVLPAALLATGAALQALLGARLTRRFLASRVPLGRGGEVAAFLLLGGPLACLLAPTLGVSILYGFGRLEAADIASQWLLWWSGDVLGMLLFAPLVLLAWPHADGMWIRGGGRVALPLLITAALLAAGQLALGQVEETAARRALDQRVTDAADAGLLALQPQIESLRGVERFVSASDVVSEDEFHSYTALARRWPGTLAVGWLPRVAKADRAAFEAAIGRPISELAADGDSRRADQRAEYFPLRLTQPLVNTEDALGFDFASQAARRSALERARDSAAVAATGPLLLMQSQRTGVLVFVPSYLPGFGAETATAHARREALLGFVAGAYDSETLFSPLQQAAQARGLVFRVSDVTPGGPAQLLAATMPVAAVADWSHDISFGGRSWRVEMQSADAYWRPGASLQARLYYLFAVLAGFLVAFAVVGAAGRNAAIAAEVTARTEELQTELDARRVAEAALRLSEQDLHTTLHSIGDAVLATDANGRVTRLNPVAERLTGWTWREAQDRSIEDVFRIVNEETRRPVSGPVAAVLSTGTIQGLANHTLLIARDGTETAIADSAAPIRDAQGDLHGVVLVFRDVGQERLTELALQASEARYRQFIELSPYGVFAYSDGRLVYANPMLVSMLGAQSVEQLLGRMVLEFLHPDGRELIDRRMHRISEERIAVPRTEQKWLRLDGSGFLGESIAVPYEHEGAPGGLVLLQDITERKDAEARLQRFFELSPDVFCVVSTDGYFQQVNPAFTDTLGWSQQELLARPLLEFTHPDERAGTVLALDQLARGQSVARLESRWLCKDGSWRWLAWKSSLRADGMLYATARDIGAERSANRQLELAKAEAETASRAKSAFLATMSHEIRTPMNGVLGMVEVLAYSELSERQADLVKTIRESATTLLGIIDDILDFSKIEAGRLQLERAPVSITDLVEGLCNGLLPVAETRNVDLSAFVAPEIPDWVLSDDVRLRQVLYNLVGNAIKFGAGSAGSAGRRGRVSIRVRVAQALPLRLEFRVADKGIGMSQETMDGLFTAFSQAEVSTTRRFGGTGLGLTICKRLSDQMGGEIVVESVVGEGSCFTVTLPFELAPEQPDRRLPDLTGVDCLLVRNPDLNADDLRRYLEHAGARVQLMPDAATAVEAAGRLSAPVVVIQNIGRQRPAMAHFAAAANVRHLLITRGRRRRVRVAAADAVTLDGDGMRRKALLRAVAVAAGRASPEVFQEADAELLSLRKPAPSVVEARAQGRLVLVAEDDAVNQKVILQQLALLGYAAEVADNGADALCRLRAGEHGLLLTDLHMPEMDGYALAEAVRRGEAGGERRLPIIALTANALRGESSRAREAGMDDYLTKPVQLKVLRAALDKWLPLPDVGAADAAAPSEAGDPAKPVGVVDVTVLRSLVGDDPETLRELLQDYLSSLGQLAGELTLAVGAEAVSEVAAIAHKLKSSSRSVGALALGELCAELELAGKAADMAAVAGRLAGFERSAAAANAAVEAYLSEELRER